MLANHDASLAELGETSSLLEAKTLERRRHEELQRAEREGRAPKRGGVLGKFDELTAPFMDDPAAYGAKLDANPNPNPNPNPNANANPNPNPNPNQAPSSTRGSPRPRSRCRPATLNLARTPTPTPTLPELES